MRELKTTGDLRSVLLEAINDVRHGHLDPKTAHTMSKLASQVTECMYVELRANKFMAELGEKTQSLGELPLRN